MSDALRGAWTIVLLGTLVLVILVGLASNVLYALIALAGVGVVVGLTMVHAVMLIASRQHVQYGSVSGSEVGE